jgi:hypothetical protein
MTKKSVKVEVNNFIGGLVTEASPLNFPANATTDELNFVLNRDGTRDRRFGMDFEVGFNYIPTGTTSSEIAESAPVPFKWLNVGGDASIQILVIQANTSLIFLNLNNTVLSSLSPLGTVSLAGYGFSATARYSFTNVNGKLIVASGAEAVAVVSYDGTTFTTTSEVLKTRDIWGVEVASEPAYEGDSQYRGGLPSEHAYNLYNQSWGIPRQNVAGGGSPVYDDPISIYFSNLAKYPSNSEVVWTGLQYQPVASGADPYERMYPALYEQAFGANVKAAKGYFVIDLLKRGTSREAVVTAQRSKWPALDYLSTPNLPDDETDSGAKIVCEFAGRVWYAGFGSKVTGGDKRSPTLGSYVAFSQLVRNDSDVFKCYQEGDPTSRDNNDLVDTDGGLVRLSGADEIVGMLNIGATLIVFASNGVWAISGGDRNGFTATNYKTERLSTFGTIAPLSIVTDGSRALYWAADGIYVVDRDQAGELVVNNLIQKTIQSYYEAIPSRVKSTAIGVFEASGKRIRWLYYSGSRFTELSVTRELILDLTTGSFSPFEINRSPTNNIEAVSMFASTPFVAPVISGNPGRKTNSLDTRYLTIVVVAGVPYFTFSYYNNNKFLDWESYDSVGVDAHAYLTTGATTANDSSVSKQVPYLTLHFRRTEYGTDENAIPLFQSSCLVRSQWDWANKVDSNKWGSLFQGYRQRQTFLAPVADDDYETGFEVITSKSKLRGRGKAFSLFMETEAGKDCRILGWSINLNGNPV